MPSSETFDVILRLLMDEAALKRIKSGASSVADEFKKLDNVTDEVTAGIEKQEKVAIAAMKREAGAIRKLAALRSKELGELKERAAWIDSAAKPMFAAGVAGFTTITLLARNYINSTEETNEITERWAASSQKVTEAQMKIGKISAEAILPLYEKLADIAQKGAEFIEKNPGAIEAGLKASMVLAGLGGIGMLAAKGMRLYADVKMIAVGDMQLLAAKMMSDAATKQLAAAGGAKVGGGATAGTTAAKVAGTAATGAGGMTAGTAAGIGVASILIGTGLSVEIDLLKQKFFEVTNASMTTRFTVDTLIKSIAATTPLLILGDNVKAIGKYFGVDLVEQANTAVNSITGVTNATQQQAIANTNAAKSAASATSASNGLSGALGSIGTSISSFISRIVSGMGGSGAKPPKHDYTGYAYSRTYAMAQDGKRQFVMSGNMTRLAEQMLGGQLNQQMAMGALSGGGGSRVSVQWNDQRRFSGEYTKSMREAQRADTLSVIGEVIK